MYFIIQGQPIRVAWTERYDANTTLAVLLLETGDILSPFRELECRGCILSFQKQRRALLRIFITEHRWGEGQPTEEEAILTLGQGDGSSIPVPAVFMFVSGMPVVVNQNTHQGLKLVNGASYEALDVVLDKEYPGHRINADSILHFGPPAGILLAAESTRDNLTSDLFINKNRVSGLCSDDTVFARILKKDKRQTLIFAGVNTDQCVLGTLLGAYYRGCNLCKLKTGLHNHIKNTKCSRGLNNHQYARNILKRHLVQLHHRPRIAMPRGYSDEIDVGIAIIIITLGIKLQVFNLLRHNIQSLWHYIQSLF